MNIIKNESILSSSSFQVINLFENDPFVGHITTPISNLFLLNNYLSKLPIYKKDLSSLLKGICLGLVHGYFLLGPFFIFSPLRNLQNNLLISFLTTSSFIFLLTLGLILYEKVSFNKNEEKNLHNSLFNKKDWIEFSSGFFSGGLAGVLFGTFILNFFFN